MDSHTNKDPISQLIEQHDIDSVSLVAADLHGIARGKHVPAKRVLANPATTVNMSSFMVMMDYAGMPHPPPTGQSGWWPSWEEGFTDLRLVPDPATVRIVPWQDSNALVICDFEHAEGGWALDFMPRAIVRRLEERIVGLGYCTKLSVEMEWQLFRETEATAFEKRYRNLTPLSPTAQCYSLTRSGRDVRLVRPIRKYLEEFGIPIEVWSAEFGPGMQEFNLIPETALAAADTAFLFKHAVREIAAQLDLFPMFMAKLTMEGFGNGVHINHSLWRDNEPVFFDAASPDKRSAIMKHAVAGELATLRDFTIMFCPTPNSYRRFAPHYSTGHVVGWAYDNKSVALRTVVDSTQTTRIEHRTGGSDANPYLAVAACLAGMAYGIENELDPPDVVRGDGYANPSLESVPATMGEAIDAFEQSELANAYLGEDFVRFYGHTERVELVAFKEAVSDSSPNNVSDWELMRYADTV